MDYRYQAMLPQIGKDGQKALETKTVTIVGLGGVGSILADMLARNGVGLRLIDKDRVYEEDLPRQSVFLHAQIQKFKAKEAKKNLEDVNPDLKIRTFHEELVEHNLYLVEADCVVDCANELATTQRLEDFCKKYPLIVCKNAGNVGLIYLKNKLHTAKSQAAAIAKIGSVKETGALAATSHFCAAILYAEVLKCLLGKTDAIKGVILVDAWKGTVKVKK